MGKGINKKAYMMVLLVVLLVFTACGTTEKDKALQAEYATLNEEKQALTEEMVQLNMSIREAEEQTAEITEGIGELEKRRAQEEDIVEGLEEVNAVLATEEAEKNLSLQARQLILQGWQLYQTIPDMVGLHKSDNEGLDEMVDAILSGKEMQRLFMDDDYFLTDETTVLIGSASGNTWHAIQAPYDNSTALITELRNGYTKTAAIDVYYQWFSKDPDDSEALFLTSDERLYIKADKVREASLLEQSWDTARFYVVASDGDSASVRMIMPLMTYESGSWKGDETDMTYIDHTFKLEKTTNGWRLSDPLMPTS